MTKIYHIALNTFRESVRDKILYVIAFFAVLMMIASQGLGWVTVGEETQIVKHFSLAVVSFFGALIAVFVGTGLICKEIDKRTIYTILSKPVHRWQFVLGKFFGLMAVLLFVVLGMGGVSCLFVLYAGGEINAIYIQALVLLYFELMVVVALAVFFSTVSTPILAAIFTFCSYLVGQVTPDLIDLVEFKKPELNYHLHEKAVTDWLLLCRTWCDGIQKPPPNAYHRFWSLLAPKAQTVVRKGAAGQPLTPDEQTNMRGALNWILERRDLYHEEDFRGLGFPRAARRLLAGDPAELADSDIVRRNRFLLEAAFPKAILKEAELEGVSHVTKEHLTDLVAETHWLWKPFSQIMYHVLPDLTHFQLRNRVVYGRPLKPGRHVYDGEFCQAISYAVFYAMAVLCLAILAFDRKQF